VDVQALDVELNMDVKVLLKAFVMEQEHGRNLKEKVKEEPRKEEVKEEPRKEEVVITNTL
jgi:hypothetical protein